MSRPSSMSSFTHSTRSTVTSAKTSRRAAWKVGSSSPGRPHAEHAAWPQVVGDAAEAAGRVEGRAGGVERLVGGVVDVDEDEVVLLAGRAEEQAVDVLLHDLEARVVREEERERDEALLQPADHGRLELDHAHAVDLARRQRGVGRVSQPEAAHEDREPLAAVQRHAPRGHGLLRGRVQAAHEHVRVDRHLGDDDAGPAQELAAPQAQRAPRRVDVVEDLEDGALQARSRRRRS